MIREAAIISIWVFLIGIYFAKKGTYLFSNDISKERMLTDLDLARYNGKNSPYLYLSIMGKVFDVSKGAKHYGEGASYNFFVGKDATRSFVDGNFECKKNCDDITGLNSQELRSLDHWLKFYDKSYIQIGKLVGKYYGSDGTLTPYGRQVKLQLTNALKEETEEDRIKMKYPDCNLEWDMDRGTHVWCTDQSGGIKRNWVGLPRKFYSPGSNNYRCACVKEQNLSGGSIEEYEGCDPKSFECFLKK